MLVYTVIILDFLDDPGFCYARTCAKFTWTAHSCLLCNNDVSIIVELWALVYPYNRFAQYNHILCIDVSLCMLFNDAFIVMIYDMSSSLSVY